MSSYSIMHVIHVWMGTVATSDELDDYFRIDPASRDAGQGASQFDRDTGLSWYDDDLIGVYYAEPPSLAACLDELPTSIGTIEAVRAAYAAHSGSAVPNALFYYTDADLVIADPTRLFGGLRYLGAFDNS